MTKTARTLVSAMLMLPSLHAALPAGRQDQSAAATETVTPVWAKPDHFWYRKNIPGGHVWLNVDAEHGVKEPLFDHQRLAIELNLRTGGDYTPLTLPFADPAARFVVKYDGSNAYIQEGAMAVEFILDARHWRCELQVKWDWNKVPPTDYECLPRGPVTAEQASRRADAVAAPPAVRSPDGRWEALIRSHNVVVQSVGSPARPVVLSSDGTLTSAYQAGSVRWSPDSRTVTAYRVDARVWLSDSIMGSVKNLIAKGVWTVPATAAPRAAGTSRARRGP